MSKYFEPIKDEFTEKLKSFDYPNLNLVKSLDNGFHFDGSNFTIEIPISRLNSDDFELGLAHELTETTLRKLILPIVNKIGVGNSWDTRFKLHEVTILSLERYSVIQKEWDCLERDFEKAFQDKLNKLPASQKNPLPASDSEKKKESSNISKVES